MLLGRFTYLYLRNPHIQHMNELTPPFAQNFYFYYLSKHQILVPALSYSYLKSIILPLWFKVVNIRQVDWKGIPLS